MKKICQVCEAEPGEFSCERCGRLVGKNCWRKKLCKDCLRGTS